MILTYLFLGTASFFNALADKVKTRYDKTLFSRIKKIQKWTDPKISHKNKKHKNSLVEFLLSTVFVMFTDLWHFLKALWLSSFILMVITSNELTNEIQNFNYITDWIKLLVSFCIVWGFIFELTYRSDYSQ